MHSVRLQEALSEFADQAAAALQAEVREGAEVPFELDTGAGQRGGPALYCYRPLTGEFIAHRWHRLEGLHAHPSAARALGAFDGLDRYLAAAGMEVSRRDRGARVRSALRAFLGDAFADQSEFELRPERLRRALGRLEQAALGGGAAATLVATLHGLTIISSELRITHGLTIARPEALEGLPAPALARTDSEPDHLVAVLTLEDVDPGRALLEGPAVLKDLLRALRLFGDGRVTLGAMAWTRIAGGGWSAIALGAGGHPRGMLLVTPEQEDELRAFCSLVSRRAPDGDELAWALRRYELGCDRDAPYEALSDHLMALRALLEPEGPASGMLPGRLAALCATAEQRNALAARVLGALELERAVIAGTASGGEALVADIADHLRALLRDVICGHLDHDLAGLADELLLEREEPAPPAGAAQPSSAEEMPGDLGESQEILDLSV